MITVLLGKLQDWDSTGNLLSFYETVYLLSCGNELILKTSSQEQG